MKNLKNWLAVWHTEKLGPIKFQQILRQDPELSTIPPEIKPDWQAVARDLAWLDSSTAHTILTLQDPSYPRLLQEIHDPPPVLYVKGKVASLAKLQLAIVGSRSASNYGLQQAQSFGKGFAARGLTITSGLALGIDSAAHRAALVTANGETIAVLGHGLDRIYPASNYKLAQEIANRGALISEFPIGVPPLAKNFPRRNRIISGLSLGVLVIEAAAKSGSLLTAKAAVEQNREVFAIPGAINSPMVKGCHDLIRKGAKLVECEDDVLEELGGLLKYTVRDTNDKEQKRKSLDTSKLDDTLKKVLSLINFEVTPVDVIVQRSGLPASEVGAMLLHLELEGFILSLPGGFIAI